MDKSDEQHCEKIILHPSYLKDIAPPSPAPGKKPELTLSLKISNILNVDEVESIVKLQFGLIISWRDSRLTFQDLNDDESLNSMTLHDKQSIWIPSLIFTNTNGRFHARYDTGRSIGKITRFTEDGERILSETSSYDNHLNAGIFLGKDW